MSPNMSNSESVTADEEVEMPDAADGDNDDNNEMETASSSKSDDKDEEELRKEYADWPLRNIKEPHDNDVMYGRGGGTNHHPGNKRYRQMVEDRKLEYVNSKRLDKPLVALEIIRVWRAQIPPGRFLKMDDKKGVWNDVGDKKAREKTSQALREKAPLIRKQQEDERGDNEDEDEEVSKGTKTTRFAAGTKDTASSNVKKAVLARDHSLEREYLQDGEAVSLEGFTWQDPFKTRDTSLGPARLNGAPPPSSSYPAGRISSHGSLGMAPPHHATSIGAPPPPPDYWGRVDSTGRQREFSNGGRYDSWGPSPYAYPPPPPPMQAPMHQRSGSWTHPGMPPSPQAPSHNRSGSWGGREHSLSMIPLMGASIAGPADRQAFDSSRSWSGYWGDSMPSPARGGPPPPPHPHAGPYGSGGPAQTGPYRQPPSPTGSTPSPKPPYSVDMSIARSWSGGEVQRSWSGEHPPSPYDGGQPQPASGADFSPMRGSDGALPRPQIVKRDTSHQNESYQTKPSVKKAALNRDSSMTSNRLKAQYMPDVYEKKFDTEQQVRLLSNDFEQSKLSPHRHAVQPRPSPVAERVSTIDIIAADFMAKPQPLLEGDRISTIDTLDINLDEDPPLPEPPVMDGDIPKHAEMPKPSGISGEDRLTTKDFMELVNSPIGEDERPVPKNESLNEERKIAEEWLTQV